MSFSTFFTNFIVHKIDYLRRYATSYASGICRLLQEMYALELRRSCYIERHPMNSRTFTMQSPYFPCAETSNALSSPCVNSFLIEIPPSMANAVLEDEKRDARNPGKQLSYFHFGMLFLCLL